MKSEPLKEQVSGYMTSCLKAKSHSVSNTKRTVHQIFDTAISTRSTEKEKDVLRWVQFCVETCLSQQEQEEASPPSTQKSSTSDKSVSNADTPRPKKKAPAKKEAATTVESDSECQDEDGDDDDDDVESVGYDKIGASDDDYVPSDTHNDGDQQVPTTPRRKAKPKKEKEGDDDDHETKKKPVARRKKEEDQPAFILPNAGSKAVVSYFTSAHPMAASEKSGLNSNHFAKSYFFPSKESFNVSE